MERNQAQSQLADICDAIRLYRANTGRYPSRLEDLIERPADVEGWYGPFLDATRVPLDPWGREYVYREPEPGGQLEVSSYGADGAPGGQGEDADLTMP